MALDGAEQFDIVNAARVLQWADRPGDVVRRMRAAARAGGLVVALDYIHARLEWVPKPPAAWRSAFDAFLAWRTAHGWDNEMGAHLAAHFTAAGLVDVTIVNEDEVVRRGEAEFAQGLDIWRRVVGGLGAQMCAEGYLGADALRDGLAAHATRGSGAESQRMVLRAAVGREDRLCVQAR